MFFRDDDSMPIRRASLRRNASILDFFKRKKEEEEEVSPSDIKSQAVMINKLSPNLFTDLQVQVLANSKFDEVDAWNMQNGRRGAPSITHVLGLFFFDPDFRYENRKTHRYVSIYMSGSLVVGISTKEVYAQSVFSPSISMNYLNFRPFKAVEGKPLLFALKYIKQHKLMYPY